MGISVGEIDVSKDEISSKTRKKIYITNKTNVYHNDDTWRSDFLHSKNFGPDINRDKGYITVVFDDFSKIDWTVLLKIRNAQTTTISFDNILKYSNRKPSLIETDDAKKIVKKIFTNLWKNKNTQRFTRITSLGAVFAERFNRTLRDLFKRPVFEKSGANLPTTTKQYRTTLHSSTKSTPDQATFKNNEGFFYQNSIRRRKKIKSEGTYSCSC